MSRGSKLVWVMVWVLVATARGQSYARGTDERGAAQESAAQQIFALANQARAQAGVGRLEWDGALATAAMQHCLRMAATGAIAHQYAGEADLSARAAQAGAHFSMIEENVAEGPSASVIHEEWMESPGHRSNLLNPEVDRVGVAVVASRGALYAVADYARAVEQLNAPEVEARVAAMIRASGLAIVRDPSVARAACATDEGTPRATGAMQPRFVMRWQDADLSRLPAALSERIATGRYHQADVGSCSTQGQAGSFTAYRVAVVLY